MQGMGVVETKRIRTNATIIRAIVRGWRQLRFDQMDWWNYSPRCISGWGGEMLVSQPIRVLVSTMTFPLLYVVMISKAQLDTAQVEEE